MSRSAEVTGVRTKYGHVHTQCMTIAKLLKTVIDNPLTQVQYLSECLMRAKSVAKTKNGGGYTRVEFGTTSFHPNDAVNQQGARYVGMIVWIPREEYDKLQETE